VSREKFAIAQVAPYAWERHHDVNAYVRRLSEELAARGHRVLVVAPSESRPLIAESRRLLRRASDKPEALFASSGHRVLAIGQSLSLGRAKSTASSTPSGSAAIGIDRDMERLLRIVPLDFVHVHEPFAPSAASAALRHSRALNVGSFHQPTERVLSTQVARRFVELHFGRLDARTATYATTAKVLERHFAGDYEVIGPGANDLTPPDSRKRSSGHTKAGASAVNSRAPIRILYCATEERGALRLFLRALRELPMEPGWEATVWGQGLSESATRISRRLRERVAFVTPKRGELDPPIGEADIVCAASLGVRPSPAWLQSAMAAGAVPVASDLEVHRELLDEGRYGLLFPAGDTEALAGQVSRLIANRALRHGLVEEAQDRRRELSWGRAADEFEAIYARLAARRHTPKPKAQVHKRLADRPVIYCDLHMHTDHSPDCATPVDVLLETAKARGLGAIAITDHNEISGALEARERANGIKVIVAEEVKTAGEGEVIGLFIEEKIPRGMTMAETIAEIRRQGGLVYVPHPFDRLHTVPDYEHLLKIVEEIDILEVFNPRVAFSAFNEEAERFAAKYRIVAGAGSDSHVAQGLGSVRIRLHDFEGPEEFLEAMRDADIVRKHKNLVYVQALKFLQTAGRPKPGRRARAAKRARPVKGGLPRGRRRRGKS
jgi:predicted metal-dependent phosphoesterase TrpH/glycosyltransferase involved in cell wall biosynthesis